MSILPKILDYSRYVSLIRNHSDRGDSESMSILQAFDILMEMNEPNTPDVSYAFNDYIYKESMDLEGANGDQRITERGLNQLGALKKYGCCPESSFHTSYDPPNTEPRPSDNNMIEALGYCLSGYTPYPGIKLPSIDHEIKEIKQLLYNHGPLVMIGVLDEQVITLIGYNDETRKISYVNCAPVSTGSGGIRELGYDVVYERFQNREATVIWMEITPPPNPEKYVARVSVTNNTSRNKFTIKIGVEGLQPLVVWDRNCQINMPDDNKDLTIDIPLPAYTSQYWPPDDYKWYVEIRDDSTGLSGQKVGKVNEITFVKRKISNIKNVFGGKEGIIYAVTEAGDLIWYRHTGYETGTDDWKNDTGRVVGKGWGKFKQLFGGIDGIIYAVDNNKDLFWFKHLGQRDGSDRWGNNGKGVKIGQGWNYKQSCGGDEGVIYNIDEDGNLFWYKHIGYKNGLDKWENQGNKRKISTGWDFIRIFRGKDGILYAVKENGGLYWFKHLGYQNGSSEFKYEANNSESGRIVGTGWSFRNIFGGRNGVIYVVTDDGAPGWYKHIYYEEGIFGWENGARINKIRPAQGFFNRHCALDVYVPTINDNSIYHGGTLKVMYFKPIVPTGQYRIPKVKKTKVLR